jgi:hypothetical protein
MVGLKAKSSEIDKETLPCEQLYLVSDRDVYCVDEVIHIKVYCQNSSQQGFEWSKIVYCEVITPDGRSLAKEKFLITDNYAKGDLVIPRNVLSGNYYLRTYTRWMRNHSPYSFNYKPIKIINPYTSELLTSFIASDEKIRIQNSEKGNCNLILIEKHDSIFPANGLIGFHLKASCDNCFQNNLTISIVKKGTVHTNYLRIDGFDDKINEINYLPETRGVSISGKVVNKADSIPVAFASVWITLLTDEPVTREALTDTDGKFYFDLGTITGKYDLFIQSKTLKPNVEPVICVDNDFSFSKLNLPFIPFEISDSEREFYESIMMYSQLHNLFMPVKSKPDSIIHSFDKLFYGKPDYIVVFDNFIELPTMEDYIKELFPNIRIKKEGTKRTFKLNGSNPDMAFYDPLVMVNLIKFNEADNILELSPKLIDRVELIEVPYLRGEIIYGGIIHFITKSADYSNINFPDGSIFVEYDMIGANEKPFSAENSPEIPTIGNSLYWNPSLKLNSDNETEINVNSGSEAGEYEIVIEGLDKNDKPFQVKDSFTVK